MSRRSPRPLKKHTIRLYEGDTDILDEFYAVVGHNAAIREIVHKFCNKLVAKRDRVLSQGASLHESITFSADELDQLNQLG